MGVVVEIIMDPRTLFKVRTLLSRLFARSWVQECLPLFLEPTLTPACRLLVVQCKHLSRRIDME